MIIRIRDRILTYKPKLAHGARRRYGENGAAGSSGLFLISFVVLSIGEFLLFDVAKISYDNQQAQHPEGRSYQVASGMQKVLFCTFGSTFTRVFLGNLGLVHVLTYIQIAIANTIGVDKLHAMSIMSTHRFLCSSLSINLVTPNLLPPENRKVFLYLNCYCLFH